MSLSNWQPVWHFQYQNISGGNVIRSVRQLDEVVADFSTLLQSPNVSPRNILVLEMPQVMQTTTC